MHPSNPSKPHTLSAWLATLTAALFFFFCFIQLNLFSAINSQIMQEFSLSALQLGKLSSMYFYGNAIFLFPAGILLDRFSTKKLLLAAVILCTAGTFLFATATNYPVAAFARFLVGSSGAFCFLSCIRIASRWFPASRMAFVTGTIVTMAMLGGMVAQTPMALLSDLIGWRNAVFLNAALGLFVIIATALFVQDRPPESQKAAKADKDSLKALGLWRCISIALINPQNWLGGLYTSLLNLPVFLLGALWGIPYLIEVHGLSAVQASYATTLFFVGVILGSPAYGWLSDHLGLRRRPMIIGAVLSLGLVMILIMTPSLSLTSLITLFFLLGFATSSQVLAYPTIAELNPSYLTSTSVSIASMSIMLSGVIFQPLFGYLMELQWDHHLVNGVPSYSVQDYNNAMWIFPICFALGLIISLLIKETYCRSADFTAQSELDHNRAMLEGKKKSAKPSSANVESCKEGA